MWTRGLARWYAAHGRHDLPWRQTRDPWLILVSEVMLQQTQVRRVLPKWQEFVTRWPAPDALAAASRGEVLRAWQGLGYPRRAVALHRAAVELADGWPRTERGLRALPGIGEYTARALLALAFARPSPLPRDVNITRVAARAALGVDPNLAPAPALQAALDSARPRRLSRRHYAYALFDVGALHCRSTPRCSGCPLAAMCAYRTSGHIRPPGGVARRSPRYAGSTRELRGRLLAAVLAGVGPGDLDELHRAVRGCAAARRDGAVEAALEDLQREGLLADDHGVTPASAPPP